MNDLVSIIVPCYNQARFLPETLDSVLAQTHKNWECIIVNDGSPDNTEDVANLYCSKDSRFIYLPKKNGGLSSARNAGLLAAKGNYIQFLDSDDLLSSDKLENQVGFLKQQPGVDIIISESKYFEDGFWGKFYQDIGKTKFKSSLGQTRLSYVNMLDHNCFSVSSALLSKVVIEKIGFFDENLKSFEDWDYWLRSLSAGIKIHSGGSISSCTYIRIHMGSMSWNAERMFIAYITMQRKMFDADFANKGSRILSYYKQVTFEKNILFHLIEGIKNVGYVKMIHIIEAEIPQRKNMLLLLRIVGKNNLFLSILKYGMIIRCYVVKMFLSFIK